MLLEFHRDVWFVGFCLFACGFVVFCGFWFFLIVVTENQQLETHVFPEGFYTPALSLFSTRKVLLVPWFVLLP